MGISRVIIRVTPFRALITLLITYLLSPLPLQVGSLYRGSGTSHTYSDPMPLNRMPAFYYLSALAPLGLV